MAETTPIHTMTVSGWAAHDPTAKISPYTFKRRENGENDVTIKILYCGICHTDLHFVKNDWGITMYPAVPGHEITGIITKMGSNVKNFKVGDRVGFGGLAASCLKCDLCKDGQENYCEEILLTHNGIFWDGSITYGGYSEFIVADHRYVVRVPERLAMDAAAPLLCAGITVYAPMKDEKLFETKGKRIGIVGLGGLGHVAVKFGKAFGHHVTVISTSPSKEKEAKERLGADDFVVSTNAEQMQLKKRSLDFILDTVSAHHSLGPILELLKINGTLAVVGAPDRPMELPSFPLIFGKRSVKGSIIGSIKETQDMMDFCGKHNITCDIEVVGTNQINEALDRLAKNDVRYRFVIDIAGDPSKSVIASSLKIIVMKTITWSKLKFPRKGRHVKEDEHEEGDSLMSKTTANVNEEYKEAFRTKSYIEICEKVQGGHLEVTTNLDEGPSSSLSHHQHFLEPHQQTLISMIESSNHHQFLVNYLEVTLEASKTCESLLTKIHEARRSYRAVKNVIKLIKRAPDCKKWTHDYCNTVYKNLAWFAKQGNPFSTAGPRNFQELHKDHQLLFQKLTSKCRKTKRRAKFIRVVKKSMASFLVIGCGALAVILLILAMHSMVVVMAAPGLMLGSLGFSMMKRNRRITGQKSNKKCLQGLARKFDIAARGVYIMMNDFGTISRLVRRLYDEMEHRRFIADICVRKGRIEMVREVVKEFEMHDSCFVEELEELEKQIYLCFLDINRSRRLLVRETNG